MVLFLLCFYLGDHAGLIVNSEENKGLCPLDETLFANALLSNGGLKALISCHHTSIVVVDQCLSSATKFGTT